MAEYYVMPIEGGEPELDGPYPDFDTMLTEAKKHWSEMNQEMDVICYLHLDDAHKPSVCYFTNDQMDEASEYCDECRVKDHDVCSMTAGCPCCDDTIANQ